MQICKHYLRTLHILIHLFIAILYSRFYYYPPFTDEGIVVQRDELPQLHRVLRGKLGLESR